MALPPAIVDATPDEALLPSSEALAGSPEPAPASSGGRKQDAPSTPRSGTALASEPNQHRQPPATAADPTFFDHPAAPDPLSTEEPPQPVGASGPQAADEVPEGTASKPPPGHPAAQPADPAEHHASADAAASSDAGADPAEAASTRQSGQHAHADRDGAQAERDPQAPPRERAPVAPSHEGADAALPGAPEAAPLAPSSDAEPETSELGHSQAELDDPVLQPASDAARAEAPRRALERADLPARRDLPRTAASLARLRAAMEPALGSLGLAGGWHELEMQLENGNGSMTVRTHRDDERVSVAVAFSDPSMRALASAQAGRLEDALRASYDAPVDFSLLGGGSEQAGSRHASDGMPGRSQHGVSAGSGGEIGAAEGAVLPHRPRRTGTHHEWIG